MILLPNAERKCILTHVEAHYPNEACGMLLGKRVGKDMLVITTVASPNVADNPAHQFEIDPGLRLRVQKYIRNTANEIIGHYHSHPDTKAWPSATDRMQINENNLVWLIASVEMGKLGRIAAFKPRRDCIDFDKIKLQIT